MLIAYIDESYDVKDRVGYWMAAVVVHERDLKAYWSDLLEAAHLVVPALPVGTELHGSDLFGNEGMFKGIGVQQRIDIYRRGLQAIGNHDARVVVSAHVPGAFDAPPLRDWRLGVLRQLVPQLEHLAREAGEFIVLVCDEEHTSTTRVIEMLHEGKTAAGVHSTPILETAMFARSAYSPGVWPADLVAFAERRLELDYGDDAQRRRTLRRFRRLYADRCLEPVILTGVPDPEKV